MNKPISIESLSGEIRMLYRQGPLRFESMIQKFMEEKTKGALPAEKLALLENLVEHFRGYPEPTRTLSLEAGGLSRLFTLLMGERISGMDLSSPELPEKLALSLNTIFDSLNQIHEVIQVTLFGKKVELETIRQILSSRLEGAGESESLPNYLGQIREAFLVAHRAFQQAAQAKMEEILTELNPERIEAEAGGLKFGPFRKASLYEMYKEKYYTCLSWFESGRLMKDLLREFERVCQKHYQVEIGGGQ